MDSLRQRVFYGDRQLSFQVLDLLKAPTEVIVVPAMPKLTLGHTLVERIAVAAGDALVREMQQLIDEYGDIEPGMAMYTSAGTLPFRAIIHAVTPTRGEPQDLRTLEQAVSRSLQLCDLNEWPSVAFAGLGMESVGDGGEAVAQALHRAVARFWDARQDCDPKAVTFCLDEAQYQAFAQALLNESKRQEHGDGTPTHVADGPPAQGFVDLSDEDIAQLNDTDIDEWFK